MKMKIFTLVLLVVSSNVCSKIAMAQSIVVDAPTLDEVITRMEHEAFNTRRWRSMMNQETLLHQSCEKFHLKDPFGRLLQLTRHDYILQPACEPVIYIYSHSQKEYQIKLGPKIKTLSTYPHHDVTEGWSVKGSKDGSITLSENARKYKYLFWEGTSGHLPPKTDGFIVHVDSLNVFFLETLKRLGLNNNESRDFTEYWIPQLDHPDVYYRISFYSQALIDHLFPLEIVPKPKQIIRILIDYEVIGKERMHLSTPSIVTVDRIEDELLVEWGGVKRPPKL